MNYSFLRFTVRISSIFFKLLIIISGLLIALISRNLFPHFAPAYTGCSFVGLFIAVCPQIRSIFGGGVPHFPFPWFNHFIYWRVFFSNILWKDAKGILLNTCISEKALFLALNWRYAWVSKSTFKIFCLWILKALTHCLLVSSVSDKRCDTTIILISDFFLKGLRIFSLFSLF